MSSPSPPQEALNQVQTRLTERLATAQIVSIQIPVSQPHNPWIADCKVQNS